MRTVAIFFMMFWLSASFGNAMTLEDVERNLSSINVFRSNFSQTRYVSGLSEPLESSGHLLLLKNSGLAWIQKKPFEVSFIFTEEHFVQKFPGQGEKVTKRSERPQIFRLTDLFATIFSGGHKFLKDYFELQFFPQDNDSWKIILVPIDARLKKVFMSVQLLGSQLINQATIYETSGNKTVINFYDMKTDSVILSDEENYFFKN